MCVGNLSSLREPAHRARAGVYQDSDKAEVWEKQQREKHSASLSLAALEGRTHQLGACGGEGTVSSRDAEDRDHFRV